MRCFVTPLLVKNIYYNNSWRNISIKSQHPPFDAEMQKACIIIITMQTCTWPGSCEQQLLDTRTLQTCKQIHALTLRKCQYRYIYTHHRQTTSSNYKCERAKRIPHFEEETAGARARELKGREVLVYKKVLLVKNKVHEMCCCCSPVERTKGWLWCPFNGNLKNIID